MNATAQLQRTEKLLALSVAFVLLRIDPPTFAREEICRLCVTVDDVIDACRTMRDAGPNNRILAALRFLHSLRPGRSLRRYKLASQAIQLNGHMSLEDILNHYQRMSAEQLDGILHLTPGKSYEIHSDSMPDTAITLLEHEPT